MLIFCTLNSPYFGVAGLRGLCNEQAVLRGGDMWLAEAAFRTVVSSTPLVSIDLVVENPLGEILLGKRLNRPAQGSWFVPGGRVLKNESLDNAFRRLSQCELGSVFERCSARLLGVYEHFSTDSVFGYSPDLPDTHYIVLAYHLCLESDVLLAPPAEQHERYRWWSSAEIIASAEVHENTRAYLSALG